MARIAIIGGSGFIGSHTADLLLKGGHEVTIVDLLQPPAYLDVKYIHADITNYNEAQAAIGAFDYVYMLAACKYVNVCYNDPVYGVNTNIQGLTNVLQACKNAKVDRVIFSSSVWVYNGCDGDWVDEKTVVPAHITGTLYGYTKVVGEGLIRCFNQLYGLDYTILRYGVAYGPGASDETVISKFLRNACLGKPLVICGTGSVSRNFLYVTDHARANVLALQDVAKNETFNIEGAEKVTVKQVAEIAKEMADRDVEIQYTPSRTGEFNGKVVRTEKANNVLGWEPEVSFSQGMEMHYNWLAKKKCYV